jgi:hypothetical protein
MLFDFHRHLSPTFASDVQSQELVGACIHPSWLEGDFEHYVEYLQAAAELRGNSSIPIFIFGAIDFSQNAEVLAVTIAQQNLAGVKLHPRQNYPLRRDLLAPYMAVIAAAGIPLYIHTDWEPSREFGAPSSLLKTTFVKVARWFPQVTMIMGHAGNNDSYLFVKNYIRSLPNVYMETSLAPVPAELTRIVQLVGSKRMLFGSNAPHGSYAVERKKIEVLLLPDRDKENILYYSAKALMEGEIP